MNSSFFVNLNTRLFLPHPVQHKEIKYCRRKMSELCSEGGGSQLTQFTTTGINVVYQNFCLYNTGKLFQSPYLISFSPLPQT